jgi:hypothetical protein
MRAIRTIDKPTAQKTAALLLLAILAVAAGLRLWQLSRPALWEDDYLNLDRGLMPLSRMWEVQKWQGPADTPYDFQPPLSFALLHLALKASRTVEAARILEVTAGVVAVWGVFALARGLFGTGPGLLAALLVSFSLFHLGYSRSIKAYSLFFCFSAWSAAFISSAATQGRWRDWLAWAATATGMLYSGYIGAPAFAGEVLWAALALGWRFKQGEPGAGRQILLLAGSGLAASLAYLPWLPAVFFLQRMFSDPGADPLARLSWAFARDVLAQLYTSPFDPPAWFVPVLLLLSLAGVIWAWRTSRGSGLVLLLLWAGLPTASVLLSKSVMSQIVSARHLFNMLGLMTILPAAGAWGISRLIPGQGKTVLAGALCLVLIWPQAARLGDFYGRSISQDREYFYWLWATAQPGDALVTTGWKRLSKAFAARWYVPGLYGSAGDFASPGFRELLVLGSLAGSGALPDIPEARTLAEDKYGPFITRTQLVGVLSRSPLEILPDQTGIFAYEDDFSSLRMLADAYSARNTAPDPTLEVLAPMRASLPGECVYHFQVPAGVNLEKASLDLEAELYKANPEHPADSALEVLAGPDIAALSPLGHISQDSFAGPNGGPALEPCRPFEEQAMYRTCAKAQARFDLGGAGWRDLWVALRYHPGMAEGYLVLKRLRLQAQASQSNPAISPMSMELTNLLANGHVRPWRPGAVSLGGLFAFAAGQGLAGLPAPVGSARELADFRQENPGLSPAHILRDGSGQPMVYFYDPALRLDKDRPQAVVYNPKAFTAQGLVLSGRLNAPSLLVGDQKVDIPVVAPRGSVLMLGAGARGSLVWSPDFSRETFARLDFSSSRNIRPAPDMDNDGGLTCLDDNPCSFTARLVSALPMNRVRLEWYPRVVADASGKNLVRLSYSTDEGEHYQLLEEFKGQGTGEWTELFAKHARSLEFQAPAHCFLLKAELSGEAAQLWSHRRAADRMWIEASLDARSVGAFTVPGGEFPVSLAELPGNEVCMRFLDRPVPIFDSIKDWR